MADTKDRLRHLRPTVVALLDGKSVTTKPTKRLLVLIYSPASLLWILARLLLLHPLSVNRDEVVDDDQCHCGYAEAVRQIGEGTVGDHLGTIVDQSELW